MWLHHLQASYAPLPCPPRPFLPFPSLIHSPRDPPQHREQKQLKNLQLQVWITSSGVLSTCRHNAKFIFSNARVDYCKYIISSVHKPLPTLEDVPTCHVGTWRYLHEPGEISWLLAVCIDAVLVLATRTSIQLNLLG